MPIQQPTDEQLQALAMGDCLPDGVYLTVPKWGYSERLVNVSGGNVSLVENGEHKFTQFGWFRVNNAIKKI